MKELRADPSDTEIDLDGYEDSDGIRYIGKAIKGPNKRWLCLANVAGALCRVEVKITFQFSAWSGFPLGDPTDD